MSGDYHWVCMYLLCATQIQKQHHSFILPTEPEKSRFTVTEKSRMPVKWWNCTEPTSGITKHKRFAVFKLRKATVQIDTTEKDLECALSELRKSEDSLQEALDSKKNVNPCCEGVGGGYEYFLVPHNLVIFLFKLGVNVIACFISTSLQGLLPETCIGSYIKP